MQARFGDASRLALRTPFRGGTWQPGIADTDGEERTASLTGSAKALPCRAQWDFATDGPLGWLAGARQPRVVPHERLPHVDHRVQRVGELVDDRLDRGRVGQVGDQDGGVRQAERRSWARSVERASSTSASPRSSSRSASTAPCPSPRR